MTRNEIIRAMRSVCDKDKVDAWINGFWTITQEELERFAALVSAAEREASVTAVSNALYGRDGCGKAIDAIRARGEK